jgi:hypothetical protein
MKKSHELIAKAKAAGLRVEPIGTSATMISGAIRVIVGSRGHIQQYELEGKPSGFNRIGRLSLAEAEKLLEIERR